MSEEEPKAKAASQDRRTLIRLASTFPAGDGMRRAILSGLQTRERKTASGQEARLAAKLTQQKIKDAIKNNSEILRQIKGASDVDPKWVSALEKQIAGLSELLEQAEMKRAIQASAKTAGHPLGDRAAVNKETGSLLKGWVAGGVRDWDKVVGKFYLNDLSKAYDQLGDFEKALGRMRNGITDLWADYIQHSDYGDFYDELTDSGFYELETAIEEAEHDLTQMIDKGWADDGYEDDVQQEIEDQILPDLERAMDDFKREYGRPPRVASKQEG